MLASVFLSAARRRRAETLAFGFFSCFASSFFPSVLGCVPPAREEGLACVEGNGKLLSFFHARGKVRRGRRGQGKESHGFAGLQGESGRFPFVLRQDM
jgi:hypothetical protein